MVVETVDCVSNGTTEQKDRVTGLGSSVRRHNRVKSQLSLLGESNDPVEVSFEDITGAAFRIKSGVRKTACEVG